ncbi:MAG: FeoB-associated Cys-rich membrane protein [Oscillospiraceae bacterium]|nr:FeoB-associated Cys-rich membrane protein [Oscillospiraceae bacterium]
MKAWFLANWGTILISLILIGAVSIIIVSLRNKKKQGISSCGCDCAHCAMGGSCHQK